LLSDLNRSAADVAQSTHADLGQGDSGLDPSWRVYASVYDSGTACKTVAVDSQELGLISHGIGDFPGSFVHAQ